MKTWTDLKAAFQRRGWIAAGPEWGTDALMSPHNAMAIGPVVEDAILRSKLRASLVQHVETMRGHVASGDDLSNPEGVIADFEVAIELLAETDGGA